MSLPPAPPGPFGPPTDPTGSYGSGSAPPVGGGKPMHGGHLLGRFLFVGLCMLVSFGITAGIVWFTVFSGDGDDVGVDITTPTVATSTPGTELPPASPPDTPVAPEATTPEVPTTASVPVGPQVPTGWPAALAPPEGATVRSGTGSADTQMVLVYDVAAPAASAADAVRAQLTGAGLVIGTDVFTPDGSTGSIQAAGAGQDATVAVTQAPGAAATTVSWVLRPAS